jgi:hypothetical protein
MARADRDLYLTDARRAIAAADEFDRVAGVVRVDTNDPAVLEVAARQLSSSVRSWDWDHASHGGDRQMWRVEAREFLVALGAAGVGEQQGGQT